MMQTNDSISIERDIGRDQTKVGEIKRIKYKK